MAINYTHSAVMTATKNVKEKIKKNYSSSQYIEVIDTMIANGISPIIESTDFVDMFVSGILHHSVENSRRKLSTTERFEFLSNCMLFLATPTHRKTSLYMRLHIERNISRLIMEKFVESMCGYEQLCMLEALGKATKQDIHKRLAIEHKVKSNNTLDLACVYKTVKYWLAQYNEFKAEVLHKYSRFVTGQAQKYYASNKSAIELNDLIQNYILYASKAIDKFDQNQGTLTSHIINWLSHARNITAVNENGTAFVLPTAKRREGLINNLAVSIDDDDVQGISIEDNKVEVNSEIDRVRKLAKLADPLGLARLSLDIEEYLSPDDIKKLKNVAL